MSLESNSNTSSTSFSPSFATHEEWVKHCVEISTQKLPSNPTYFWLKEDIFWPVLPDHHHVKLIKMRFRERSQEIPSPNVVELGVGIIASKKNEKEARVLLPASIQVSRRRNVAN
jgi:hypothetical protein